MRIFIKHIVRIKAKVVLALMIILCCLFTKNIVVGQAVTNYTFAASNGTYTTLTGATAPTNTGVAANLQTYDNSIAIGFDFWYMGVRRTHFGVSSNGWMTLGTGSTAITNDVYTNNLANGGSGSRPTLAPLWDLMRTATGGKVQYKVFGTAPDRTLVVEWLKEKWEYLAAAEVITFQAILHEYTGAIDFVYYPEATAYADNSYSGASIGITATTTGSGNYLSLDGTGTSPSASSTAETSTLTTKPANGQTYTFSQTAPTAPTSLTFTNIITTSMSLNWTDNASNECGYVIYTSTDGATYSFNQQVAAGSITASVTGLVANTAYYYKVYAVREGALSTSLSGNQKTATTALISSPTATWLAPCGVSSVVVECWGGGGAGGGNILVEDGGGGGGGGAYSKSTLAVTAGTTYNVQVGSGGTGTTGNGNPGNDTWFNTNLIIKAVGGLGGGASVNNGSNGGLGGSGGLLGSCIGTTTKSGGNGGNGRNNGTGTGGGGGGSAGDAGNGGNGGVGGAGAGGTAGTAGVSGGGLGATGSLDNVNGVAGSVPGGGGGGSGSNEGAGNRTGGDGANGKIIITYVDYIPTITLGGSPTICLGVTSVNLPYSATLNSPDQYSINYDAAAEAVGFVDLGLTTLPATPITLAVPGGAAAGIYNGTITVKNSSTGCSSSATAFTVTIDASAAPGAAGTIIGTAYICQGQSGVAYSIPAITNATSYVWAYSGTGATINGSTNNITIDYNGSATSGNVTVYGTRACGNGTISANYAVGIMDVASIVTNPSSTSIGCNGTPVTFTVVTVGAGLTYQWQEFIAGWLNITNGGVYSGATTEILTISSPTGFSGRQYRCVVTGSCGSAATSTAATLTVLASGMSGTYTVGTAGIYARLELAFTAINTNGLIGNVNLEIISDITETATASLNQWDNCGNNGYTVAIYPKTAARTISGSIATSLITLNGADNVTFNGKIDGTGTANSLILSNTNTAGSTIKFIADATYNTIKYCTLTGVSTTATTGVVWFSTGTTLGNSNNTITYCDIKDGATTPKLGIYANGTSAAVANKLNTVSHCNIYNQAVITTGYSSGIWFDEYCSKWTISYNSFYQETSRTDNSYFPMYLTSTAGDEFTIDHNNIGGKQADCLGAALTLTYSTVTVQMFGIYTDFSTSGVSIISNNVIKNINFTCVPISGNHTFAGIAAKGRVNVNNNIIGDNSTGSIVITLNDNGTNTTAIAGYYKLGNGFLENNTIGSITLNGTTNDLSNFRAIFVTGTLTTDVLINNNLVGSTSTLNSISTNSGATPELSITGISFGTGGSLTSTVSNNSIANVSNNCTSVNPSTFGISNVATAGIQRVFGNNIYNISSAGTSVLTNTYPVLAGIKNNNTTTGNFEIIDNRIHSLSASGAAAVNVHGILLNNAATGTNVVSNNFIHSISATSNTSEINGIFMYSGTANISNNMIRLGFDKDGNSVSASVLYRGIYKYSASAVNCYFNSVYLGGSASAGAINTYGFQRAQSAVDDFKNNIIYNARTGGTGIHYGIVINATTTFTSDYNDLYTSVGANLGSYNAGTTARDFTNWKAGIIAPKDAASINSDPLFVTPTGTSATVDLHIQAGSPDIGIGVAGTSIITDYDGQARKTGANPNGPCIGADERVVTPGTNAYGIYLPAAQITGSISNNEIVAIGGAPGGYGILIGNPTTTNYTSVPLSTYPLITEDNIQCSSTDIDFTSNSGTPAWLFGNGASPSSGAASPFTTQYSSLGRKDIIENLKVFNDFENMTMPVPSPGAILGAPAGAGCPTTYAYTSSVAGSVGYTYVWTCNPPGGCTATIASYTASTTDITFVNLTGVNQVFVLKLDITTECCGPLTQVVRYITIYPAPIAPVVTEANPQSICTGGAVAWNVSSPDPAYSYDWYTASSGGTLLGSGTSYSIASAPTGTTHYFAQATNSYGCTSARTDLVVTATDTPAPTVPNNTACGANSVTLSVTGPVAGYTYSWYSGSCGGTLLQSSSSTQYTTTITASTTVYVNATPPGCGTSVCSTPTLTYSTPPDPIVWQGGTAGTNNWFVASNWSSSCLPTCASNVSIPSGTPNSPDIGFNPGGAAAAKNIDLINGATLSFSDSRSELIVCGDFTHAGTVTTNNVGLVVFNGAVAQGYNKTNGSGKLNSVTINNTAAAAITIGGSVDMSLGTSGNLTLTSGLLVTGTNTAIVENTAVGAVSGHSSQSYVNGNLRRYIGASGSYDFPVGNTASYQLLNWNATSTSGLTYITSYFSNPADVTTGLPLSDAAGCNGLIEILNNGSSSSGFGGIWSITPDAGSATYSLTLNGTYYNNAQSCHSLVSRADASSNWSFAGSTFDSQSTSGGIVTVKRTGLTSFSHKAIVGTPSSLPIGILDFKATCQNENINLNWTTFSESNNDYFLIERSKNAINWNSLGSLKGAGNSNTIQDYSFCDNNPFSSSNYYLLKQVDYNGKVNTLDTIIAKCNENFLNPDNVTAYQVQGQFLEMLINAPEDEVFGITIYDNLGRAVYLSSKSVAKGKNVITLKIPDLSCSTYFLELRNEKRGIVKKIFLY